MSLKNVKIVSDLKYRFKQKVGTHESLSVTTSSVLDVPFECPELKFTNKARQNKVGISQISWLKRGEEWGTSFKI